MLLWDDHCLIICDMIICLIIYLGDHFYDHLLTESTALVESVALWTRLRRTSHPGNGQNRKDAARLLGGNAPLVYVIPSG